MAFNWDRSTNTLQVLLPPTPVQSVTCRCIPLCPPYANSSDSTVNELKLSWRTTRHTDGTTVPARVTAALPAVPKYTEYQTECLALMIFLFGIHRSLLHTIHYRSYRTLCFCCVAQRRTSDRDRPAVCCYQFCDDTDRKYSTEYPQLKLYAHYVCTACSVTPSSTVQLAMYKWFKQCTEYWALRNRPVQCHGQNAWHWSQL